MMRLLTLIGLLLVNLLQAQDFTVSPTTLTFGVVTELAPDSLPITITNNSSYGVNITDYRFYNTYGSPAFSCLSGLPTIAAGSSVTIYIRFQPRHNIFHDTELLIDNDGHRGPIRVDLKGQGRYSKSYYSATENLEQEVLKQSLKTITGNGYVNLVYGPARDIMFMNIDNKLANGQGATQNTIECVYTGRQAVGYIDRTDCQNLSTYSFNTEHTFPQGFFSSLEPMRSDLHHLFPTDDNANNVRGSLPFGVVNNPSWQQGGSKCDGTYFEPRDVQKGGSSRAIFYFLTRYLNYSGFVTAANETTLLQWHNQFLPDSIEEKRNSDINAYQGNRNPYVDYPQYTERIKSFIQTAVAPVNYAYDLADDTIDFGRVNPAAGNIFYYWIVNNGNQPVSISNLSLAPSNYFAFTNGSGVPTTLQPGDAVAKEIVLSTPPTGNITGTLNFTRTFATASQVTIPITALISLTGLAENNQRTISVYPNPFSNTFCLSEELQKGVLQVVDITGRKVAEFTTDCSPDLSTLQSGMYVLHLITNKESYTCRLLKD